MPKAETPTTAGHIYPSADVYWRTVESKGASCSRSVLWGHHYVPEPTGSGPSLMGRDWLYKLKPNLGIFHTSIHVGMDNHIQKLLSRHSELFKDELGSVKGVTVKLYGDPSATPRFFRPWSVPHALRGRVEQELERLEKTGIIEAIKFSDWATPVVPLVKGDGSIRICGDYKVTINRVANVESYPLPRIDDLLAGLAKGKVFSKLDLAHAYLQLQLDEESRKLATISTHKGLFCYIACHLGCPLPQPFFNAQ